MTNRKHALLLFHALSRYISFVESNGSGLCYETWDDLKTAVEGTSNEGGIFTICPDSILMNNDDDEGIEISTQNSVTIRCGENGVRENNCLFDGPTPRHFSMAFDCCDGNILKLDIKLQGITFKGATASSIYIKPGGYGSYTFKDCVWEGNGGGAGAVYVQPYPAYGDSDVTFQSCDFIRNKAVCGPIRQIQSTNMIVDSCLFMENEATAFGSTISSYCAAGISTPQYESFLSLSNSCFIGNVAKGPAVVHIDDSPFTLIDNDNNYYAENKVGTVGPWIEYSNAATCPIGVYVDEFYIADSWCKGVSDTAQSCSLPHIIHPLLTQDLTSARTPDPKDSRNYNNVDGSSCAVTFSFVFIFQLLALSSMSFFISV